MSFVENIDLIKIVLLFTQAVSFCFKLHLAYSLTLKFASTPKKHLKSLLFLIVMMGFLMEDVAWIASVAQRNFFPWLNYKYVILTIRIAWIFNIIMYQAFAIFIESFVRQYKLSLHQKVFLTISTIGTILLSFLTFFYYENSCYRPPIETLAFKLITFYQCFLLLPVSFIYTFFKLRSSPTQKILKKQLQVLANFYILPFLFFTIPLNFIIGTDSESSPFFLLFYQFSNAILTLAFTFTIRNIINIRFFNFHSHVHSFQKFNFTHDFKKLLEHLGSATSINEIKLLTQRFFSQAFSIPTAHVELYTREVEPTFQSDPVRPVLSTGNATIENFLQNPLSVPFEDKNVTPNEFLKMSQILIYDEIEYDYFYAKHEIHAVVLNFLQTIQADIFIPIYEENIIIAYIIVAQHARPHKLYSDRERDEMVVFASYLGKVINLIQNRNLNELLKQRKEIVDELYLKHQEINKYKESMRSFLQHSEQEIGIAFFKNKKLVRANKEAQSILCVDLFAPTEHDFLFQMLEQLAQEAIIYKTTQTKLTNNRQQKKIVLSAVPLNNEDVVVTIHYSGLQDLIKDQINLVKDPSNWDYLLYLETTESGKLINQLIPSKGKTFLNFKIELLKLALSKKALLLDAPEDDLLPLIELFHHISLRETLYVLELKDIPNKVSYNTELFGINYLYGDNSNPSLLERLNKLGTLCIKNIELLPIDAQNNLAQFIRYGFYNIFKSEKRVQSDVRIICTSHKNLAILVQEGKFSKALYKELQEATLVLPSLLTLPDIEISQLADGFTELALSKRKLPMEYQLPDTEKSTLAAQKPISLQEFRNRVQHLIGDTQKKEITIKPATVSTHAISDPHLHEIALLGKNALKDPRLLNILWDKFQNQNQIAQFLGVNRSSVHRRCKEYNII